MKPQYLFDTDNPEATLLAKEQLLKLIDRFGNDEAEPSETIASIRSRLVDMVAAGDRASHAQMAKDLGTTRDVVRSADHWLKVSALKTVLKDKSAYAMSRHPASHPEADASPAQ